MGGGKGGGGFFVELKLIQLIFEKKGMLISRKLCHLSLSLSRISLLKYAQRAVARLCMYHR